MKKKQFDIIWIGFGFNLFILILMVLYAMFTVGDGDKNVWNIFTTLWYLSFGWLAGRISK